MKIAVIALIAFLLTFARASPLQEAEQVIEGIIVGAFGEIGHQVQECIQDGEQIFQDIISGIDAFEEAAKTKSFGKVVEGLKHIGDALMRLPEEVKECESIPDLVEDIEKIAAEFLEPELLVIDAAWNIFWHAIPIYNDITGAISNFKDDQFEPAGENIGNIIYLIFLSAPKEGVDDAVIFTKAFYKSAFSIDLNLAGCKSSIETSWVEVVSAATKIDFSNLFYNFEGVTALSKAIPNFLDSFKTCEADWPQIQQGFFNLKSFADHPGSIPVAVTEAVTMNLVSFLKDTSNIFYAFTNSPVDFQLGGSSAGSVTKMVLQSMPNNLGTHQTTEGLLKSHGESI